MQTPKKDPQTVTSDGRVIQDPIDGVIYRPALTQVDERGTLVEIYNQVWQLGTDEMCYSYQTTIRPGYAKGWVHHKLQFDRLFVSFGRMRVILYDDRSDSPTHGLLNQFVLSEFQRGLLIIPPFVWHALENIGDTETVFINTPTQPYDHANPDKYRLPLHNDLIPYTFPDHVKGW